MTLTMNQPMSAGTSATATGVDDKGFVDFLGSVLPGIASAGAQSIGIDPRVAGQTVSQIMNLFGIGRPGKAFKAALPKEQAVAQLKEVVTPHLSDPAFAKALGRWLQAAVEPVQAHKEGKAYQPSVDPTKNWFTEALSDIGDAASSVDWGQVAQVGMQALPYLLAVI